MLEGMIMELELAHQVRLKHDEATDSFYLFCIKTGEHYRLNQTSYEILMLLSEGKRKDEIVKWISESYNVKIEACEKDIDELFTFLLEKDLIQEKGRGK